MYIKTLKILAISLITLLSACAYNIQGYGISAANVESIKSKFNGNIDKIAVNKFTAAKPGIKSLTCRAAGNVSTPQDTPFEDYIQAAFIQELKMAGLYDENSQKKLDGRLEKIDFSSSIGDGKWFIDMKMTLNGETFDAHSETPYDASFVADKACQETAQVFPQAVQNLIHEIVANPKFARVVENSKIQISLR